MIFKVEMVEQVWVTREVDIVADTPQQAHRKAYEQLIEEGDDDGVEFDSSVESRSFTVIPPDGGDIYEFDDDCFEDDDEDEEFPDDGRPK